MSAPETTPDPKPARRSSKRAEKKSLWQMDLSSIGRKDELAAAEEQIEHAPFEPTLPAVNLLPQSVKDSVAIAKIRRWLIGGILALVVVFGGLWWLQGSTIANAEADLADATAQNTKLRADLAALGPVKQMYDQITRLQDLVTTTLASQPEAALVIQSLDEAAKRAGGTIDFTGSDITYTGIPKPGDELNSCPDPDPFEADVAIGCLTFNATAQSREDVSALLRELEADPLFLGPYVTSTTATEIATGPEGKKTQALVAFSGSAGVSLEALKTKLTPEQIEAILAPPKPEPSASASPSAGGAS